MMDGSRAHAIPAFRASCCSYQPRTARPRLKATRKRLAIQAHHAMPSIVVSGIGGVELVPGPDRDVLGRRVACT